jgi:aspartate aminotransferase
MLAERMGRVSASPTMKVAAEAEKLKRQGIDVVDFGAGEPDFPTPEGAKAAGKTAIDQNFTKYTAVGGIADLKQAICARYLADYGVTFTEAETIVTAGGKQALYNIAMVLFNRGDEVITHAPFWPTIPEQVKLADANPVIVHTKPEDGFKVHPESILAAITPRTKAVIINSPGNPTGAVISEQDLAAIADACAARGLWVIVDLCYEKLIYDNVPHNLVKVLTDRMRERTLFACSASKAYSMTGWRCGWILGPKEIISAANTLQGHSTSNVASISQKAAAQALTGSQEPVTLMLNEYRHRRDKLMEWFSVDPRFECVTPAGAFYLFPRITKVLESTGIASSAEFSEVLLNEARVALTAGEGFDAPGFLRISYATSLDRLREGTTRILEFVKKRERQGAAAR